MPEDLGAPPYHELDALAAATGFRKEIAPEIGVPMPPDLKLWTSEFALLALVRIAKTESESLDQVFLDSSEWMSRALKIEEKKGRLIDGYLLLAMPSKPDATLLAEVRRVESDTSVCRKHVLWPEQDQSWGPTLYAVTTLGLPSATSMGSTVTEPELPLAAKRALQERENGTSFDAVASIIEELPENESETDEHVN